MSQTTLQTRRLLVDARSKRNIAFVAFSFEKPDGTAPTGAELDAFLASAVAMGQNAGATVEPIVDLVRFDPVELADGETLKLVVESSLIKNLS